MVAQAVNKIFPMSSRRISNNTESADQVFFWENKIGEKKQQIVWQTVAITAAAAAISIYQTSKQAKRKASKETIK